MLLSLARSVEERQRSSLESGKLEMTAQRTEFLFHLRISLPLAGKINIRDLCWKRQRTTTSSK